MHGPTTVYQGAFRHLDLAVVDDSVYVAWTAPKPQRVRLVKVPLASVTAPSGALAKAE